MLTLIKVPILGILIAAAAALIEQVIAILADTIWQREVVLTFYHQISLFLIVSVIIEESLKYLAIRFVLRSSLAIRGFKFVLSAAAIGLFWGLAETALILFSNPSYLAELRVLNQEIFFSLTTIVLVHILTALLIGAVISARLFSPRFFFLKTIFFPIIIHFLYNFLIIQKSGFTDFLLILILSIAFLINLVILAFNFRKLD